MRGVVLSVWTVWLSVLESAVSGLVAVVILGVDSVAELVAVVPPVAVMSGGVFSDPGVAVEGTHLPVVVDWSLSATNTSEEPVVQSS